MSETEFHSWITFFKNHPMDVQELQMAVLLSMTANINGGSTDVSDFIFSVDKDDGKESDKKQSQKDLDLLLTKMFGA